MKTHPSPVDALGPVINPVPDPPNALYRAVPVSPGPCRESIVIARSNPPLSLEMISCLAGLPILAAETHAPEKIDLGQHLEPVIQFDTANGQQAVPEQGDRRCR